MICKNQTLKNTNNNNKLISISGFLWKGLQKKKAFGYGMKIGEDSEYGFGSSSSSSSSSYSGKILLSFSLIIISVTGTLYLRLLLSPPYPSISS